MNARRIVLAGYYGYGNVGDELILHTILSQIRNRYKEAHLTVLSARPRQTAQTYGVVARWRWNPLSIARSFFKSDLFVLGGGGLLQDQTSFFSLAYYLGLIVGARFFRCPVVLYAVGVESLKNPFSRIAVKWILSLDKVKVTVRDTRSKDILVSLGIHAQRIHVTGDPVFSHSSSPAHRASSLKKAKRVLWIPRFPCPKRGRALFIQSLLILKKELGLHVTAALFQPGREIGPMSSLMDPLPIHDLVIPKRPRFDDIVDLFDEADFVVSARFHGLVLAAQRGKPFLGLGDPQKTGRICSAWKMPFLTWTATPDSLRANLQLLAHSPAQDNQEILDLWQQSAQLTVDMMS